MTGQANGAAPRQRVPDGDELQSRQPPHDLPAEQAVLGGMMLSKDVCAEVFSFLNGHDFYRPVHQRIFDAMVRLYGQGRPVDAITVGTALAEVSELSRVGGAPYLHTLVESVPTVANVGYYARTVADRAIERRLIEAGARIMQLGYRGAEGVGRSTAELATLAQQAVYEVTAREATEDYRVLADMLEDTLDAIEAIGERGGEMTGVPTGFTDLDRLLNGLSAGQFVIIGGRPGQGKALALDTPLPTPDGWTTMGAVRAGDQLLGADGHPTTVTHAFEVRYDRPCYEVEFSDGSVIVADAEHLWKTTTRASRRASGQRRKVNWSTEAVTQLRRAIVEIPPDSWLSVSALNARVGSDFAHIIPPVTRDLPRRTADRVPGRRGGATGYAYPARELCEQLLARVERWQHTLDVAEQPDVVTTKQIMDTLRTPTADRRANHSVQNAKALTLPDQKLPVPAYTLGAWLGDGSAAGSAFTTADPEILDRIRADGYQVRETTAYLRYRIMVPELPPLENRECVVCAATFTPRGPNVYTCGRSCGGKSKGLVPASKRAGCATCGVLLAGGWGAARRCTPCHSRYGSFVGHLRAAGVLDDKHIPQQYLRASEGQRRALLAGLLDTDGTATPAGGVQYTSTSKRLAEDVYELIVSLGYRCSVNRKSVKGRRPESSTAYTLNFSTPDDVFELTRKREAHAQRRHEKGRAGTRSRYIVDVRPVPSVPVRCVAVDNADHLYLAGRSMIPTHNSTLSVDIARNVAIRAGLGAAVFSLEMSKVELVMRILSAEARVPLHVLRSGNLADDDWTRLARRMGEISEAPLFVDDSSNITLMQLRAKAQRLKQRHNIKLLVVDYLQLMSNPQRRESRQQEVAELSRGLKLLAKELMMPVIGVCQLNRGSEQRQNKRPQLSDLRESGSLEQDADVVILLHRDDYYDKESPRAGECDFDVAKHRNGPTDTVTVAAQLHLSRFVDMALPEGR